MCVCTCAYACTCTRTPSRIVSFYLRMRKGESFPIDEVHTPRLVYLDRAVLPASVPQGRWLLQQRCEQPFQNFTLGRCPED